MLKPPLGGSVLVVSSTHGELGGPIEDPSEHKSGVPLNAPPEVEVDETKYVYIYFWGW